MISEKSKIKIRKIAKKINDIDIDLHIIQRDNDGVFITYKCNDMLGFMIPGKQLKELLKLSKEITGMFGYVTKKDNKIAFRIFW